MKHPVVASILSLVIGMLVVMGIETLSHILYPLPFTPTMENLQEYTSQIPVEGMLLVIVAHLLGGFAAVFSVLKLAQNKVAAYVVSVLFFIATISNLFFIPHPVWFTITDVLATILGLFIAFKLVNLKKEIDQTPTA